MCRKILIFVLFLLLFTVSVSAMTADEFLQQYSDMNYIYRVNYSDGTVNYFATDYELDFAINNEDYSGYDDSRPYNAFVYFHKDGRPLNGYRLRNSGSLVSLYGDNPDARRVFVTTDGSGFDYVNVFIKSGDSFFLPIDMRERLWEVLSGMMVYIVGFLILLVAFWKALLFLFNLLRMHLII